MIFPLNTKIARFRLLSVGRLFVFILPLTAFLALPNSAQASFWSTMGDMFSGQSVSAQSESIIETSSQNMPLPEAANNFEPVLKMASEISIDGGDSLLPEVGPSNLPLEEIDNTNGQISLYVVRKGDTFAEIAEMYDVSVNTILWANDMNKSSILKAGQTLVILPMSGVMHKVVKGDTLNTIAKKYGGDVDEIAIFNDLKVNAVLSLGDTLIIPDGQVSSSIRPSNVSKDGTSKLIKSGGPDYGAYYIKPFVGGHRTQGLHGYNAVDYGMPIGTKLVASAGGTVIISKNSGWNGGYANYVVIQHPNNTQTVYGHMQNTVVSVGQIVAQGQLIGYSGNTGNSTGPHLHFEIRGAKNPF